MFLRSRGLAALTSSPRRSSASALSGSANRGDFSRIMQLEVVDSPRKISNLYRAWRNHVVRLYWISAFFNTNALHIHTEL